MFILSIFMLFPAFVALLYQESMEFQSFLITIVLIFFIFSYVYFFCRNEKRSTLSIKDGFILVALSWTFASLFGAIPFWISGSIPAFVDSFFETISGFTTTGASILTDIESIPKSILFWRSLIHWLGGMGIVVLTVAILPILGIGGLQLLKAEAPGPTVDKITPRITETAKILWFIYLGLTIAETLLLMVGGLDLFDALTHTFGTLATGGFSPKNNSVGYYNSAYIDAIITIFMIMAGINFTLHYRLITGKVKYLLNDTELKAYLLIFLCTTLIITLNLYSNIYNTIGQSLRYASFQVASILTTTGFATTDYEKWPFLSKALLFLMMAIGGCSGSTGGGIKVIRIITLFKQGLIDMKYLIHPNGIFPLKLSGNPIKKEIVHTISSFFFLYIFFLILVTMVVSTAGQDILTSFTTALATVGNIGPGFGKIGPTANYAFFPGYVKWFLSFAMLAGRLEIYTILILFNPSFWKR